MNQIAVDNGYYFYIYKDLPNLTCTMLIGSGFSTTGEEQEVKITLDNGLIRLLLNGKQSKVRDVTEAIKNIGSEEEYLKEQLIDFIDSVVKILKIDDSLIFEKDNNE